MPTQGMETPYPKPAAKQVPFAASPLPFSVVFQNNDVLNRSFIELFGVMPSGMAVARNPYERIEVAWVSIPWLMFGIAGPIVLEKQINGRTEAAIRKAFPHYFNAKPTFPKVLGRQRWYHKLNHTIGNLGRSSPLRVPWGWLNGQPVRDIPAHRAKALLDEVGFKSLAHVRDALANPVFRGKILRAKMRILGLDMAMMGFASLLSTWGKKWMTEKLSGRKGFAGEFTYSTNTYLEQQTKEYTDNKAKRFWQSVGTVVGVNGVLLPLIWASARSRGGHAIGRLTRNVTQAFDYTNGIFMSKWLVAWGGFVPWMVTEGLSARDSHEFRESMIKTGVMAATYTFGDDIFGGLAARWLQGGKKSLKTQGIAISKQGLLGLPKAQRLSHIHTLVNGNTLHPAYKAANKAGWIGLVSATLLTGLISPLLNNIYTKKKALAEQADYAERYLGLFQQPLQPVMNKQW